MTLARDKEIFRWVVQMPKVRFVGDKINRRKKLIDAFSASPDWEVTSKNGSDCFTVILGVNGVPEPYCSAPSRRIDRLLCFDGAPYGLNKYNGVSGASPLFLTHGSLCHKLADTSERVDVDRWARHAQKYGLPDPKGWRFRRDGCVLVLLPRAGGWKNPGRREFVSKYAGYIEALRPHLEGASVSLRPHPKNRITGEAEGIIDRLRAAGMEGVHADWSADLDAALDACRSVLCDWGSSGVRAVMKGVPCFWLGPSASQSIVRTVASRDARWVTDPARADFPMSPREFLGWVACNVFDEDDVESGALVAAASSYAGPRNMGR